MSLGGFISIIAAVVVWIYRRDIHRPVMMDKKRLRRSLTGQTYKRGQAYLSERGRNLYSAITYIFRGMA
jgi:hypothetical protein